MLLIKSVDDLAQAVGRLLGERVLRLHGGDRGHVRLGWFRWYGNIRLYIEVLSWDSIGPSAASCTS